jgi:hypothetical protein
MPSLLQTAVGQAPQSASQREQSSAASQVPSPQPPPEASQSVEQDAAVSPPLHLPSPQKGLAAPAYMGAIIRMANTSTEKKLANQHIDNLVEHPGHRRLEPQIPVQNNIHTCSTMSR